MEEWEERGKDGGREEKQGIEGRRRDKRRGKEG